MSKEASSVEDTEARSAMKLALEALKQMQAKANFECWNLEICDEAIKALEEALAKQEQRSVSEQLGEPVAWRDRKSGTLLHEEWLDADPLYTTPQQPSTTVRTWVGLTLDERDHLWEVSRAGLPRYNTFAGLVEAKLKEKNT